MIEEPVTLWIEQVRKADEVAMRQIWQHFAGRLHEFARRKIRPNTRRAYDEQDAVQSMFHSLCQGLEEGRYPDLENRDNLWRLMLVMTGRKISKRHRYDQQLKRDNRRLLTESYFAPNPQDRDLPGLQLAAGEPTPEFLAEFSETFERLFGILETDDLKQVAMHRIEGFDDSEIAKRLECSRSTVQRRLAMIRKIWQTEMVDDER